LNLDFVRQQPIDYSIIADEDLPNLWFLEFWDNAA